MGVLPEADAEEIELGWEEGRGGHALKERGGLGLESRGCSPDADPGSPGRREVRKQSPQGGPEAQALTPRRHAPPLAGTAWGGSGLGSRLCREAAADCSLCDQRGLLAEGTSQGIPLAAAEGCSLQCY